jgi:hypothetical protein
VAKYRYARTLFAEALLFARQNKVYWLIPLLLVLMLAALLIIGTTHLSPYLYSIV